MIKTTFKFYLLYFFSAVKKNTYTLVDLRLYLKYFVKVTTLSSFCLHALFSAHGILRKLL